MIKGEPDPKQKKEKLDPSLLRAASYRDLAHWIAILDLDPTVVEAEDGFLAWMRRCNVDVREMDEGGVVVARAGGSFLFIDASSFDLCEKQLSEVKPYWLNPPAEEDSDA